MRWSAIRTLCLLACIVGAVHAGETSETLTVVTVGDIVAARPLVSRLERDAQPVLDVLRRADATFGNFEATAVRLSEFHGHPAAESGGAWILVDAQVPADLRAMGFNLFSLANNHAMDWGVEGLRQSQSLLSRAGIAYAGAGTTLAAARAPAFVGELRRRIGLVAATSTFPTIARASNPFGTFGGRPGVSTLRQRVAPTGGAYSAVNSTDEREVLDAVRAAKARGAALVIVSLHCHEPTEEVSAPPPFAVAFAHAAIDAGADLVAGHGSHRLRGIEVYKGRPIFYSLGNFIFTMSALEAAPAEMYEALGIEPGSIPPGQLMAERYSKVHESAEEFESVIAVSTFERGRLAGIELHVVDLGPASAGESAGVPRLAEGEKAAAIVRRLNEMSTPFGTAVAKDRATVTVQWGDAPRTVPAQSRN